MNLECYRKMYALLCAASSQVIDLLEEQNNILRAKCLLEQAVLDAEELYLSCEDE